MAQPEKIDETSSRHVGEAPFKLQELFFSRTDTRGRIQSGNRVFQRVSQFTDEELCHQPHNIIRHQDMPRAVFWLLWDTIKRNQPVGAYVKNKAKDGRYYWVFAIVTPIQGGYLSVRLKPTSPLFSIVEQEYKKLLKYENDTEVKPAESGEALLNRLKEMGFKDYPSFMAHALSEEIFARENGLNLSKDTTIRKFTKLMESSKVLKDKSGVIFESYADNQLVPLNLSVKAAQLGQVAATIGVISNNYSVLSEEIKQRMSEFMDSADEVHSTVTQGLFLACTAKMQNEMMEFFKNETCFGETSEEKESGLLTNQKTAYQQKARDGLIEISRKAQQFYKACADMKRLAVGLGVTRVMGRIETSNLQTSDASLNSLMDNLMNFQNSIDENLQEIERINRTIEEDINSLLR